MTSGPSHILALTKGKTGENIIDEFRDLIGPTDVEEAKTQKPERYFFLLCVHFSKFNSSYCDN